MKGGKDEIGAWLHSRASAALWVDTYGERI